MRRNFNTMRVNKSNNEIKKEDSRIQRKARVIGCSSISGGSFNDDIFVEFVERSTDVNANFFRCGMLVKRRFGAYVRRKF